MSVAWWVGYVLGWLLIAALTAGPVVLLGVRPVRRWWLRPVLRRVTDRKPGGVAARIASLEHELAGKT